MNQYATQTRKITNTVNTFKYANNQKIGVLKEIRSIGTRTVLECLLLASRIKRNTYCKSCKESKVSSK